MRHLPTALRQEAERLRGKEGLSLHEIARTLDVSYTTARRWTLEIELTVEQQARLRGLRVEQAARASAVMAENCREQRRVWQETC